MVLLSDQSQASLIFAGNGTEDIVRNLRSVLVSFSVVFLIYFDSPRQIHLPLPSSWAPVAQMVYKPWLNENDSQDCLFASINLFAGTVCQKYDVNHVKCKMLEERFYPCSGGDYCESHDNIINIALTPIGPGPWDPIGRQKLTSKQRLKLTERASAELR